MPEERRVVAVLFATVPGLARAGGADAFEDAAELVDSLFLRFRRVIESRGGTLDKFTGEDVMAVFGAPVAHEDDALRAVRAAMAMKRELELFNAQRGLELPLRAGINLGEVLWGSVAGDRPTAMGDAVNVAKRLEGVAAQGAIVVGRAVERATAARIEYGPASAVEVRGRAEKVEMFEVVAERSSPATQAAHEAGPSRLVGRSAELERLVRMFEAGKGGAVVIEGEAGVGKTRLAAELRQRAQAGRRVWAGVGFAQEGVQVPLGPFADMVRFAARGAGSVPGRSDGETTSAWVAEVLEAMVAATVERENCAHLITQSLGQHAGETRVRHLEPASVRSETLAAWEKWARSIASRGPAVFCLEDVHWADYGTRALMEHLAEKLRGERVLLLATARTGAQPLRGFETIPLGQLSGDEARQLSRELLGAWPDEELAAFLVEHSGGNPLYLEELVRYLRAEKLIGGLPPAFRARPERLPDGLRGLLVSRIDSVSPEAREALKGGAVFGRSFWLAAVARLIGRAADGPVEQAERRRLVARQPTSLLPDDTEFAFSQTPLRDAAYSLLTRKERLRLHARAADLLEPRVRELGRRVTILAAAHREEAEQGEAAARLWEQAAQDAYAQGAYDEALSHARDAQRLGSSVGAALVAVRALLALGQHDQALAEAEEILALPVLARADRHRALYQVAHIHERAGAFTRAVGVLEEILGGDPDPDFRLDALATRCGCLYRMARYDDALRDIEELQRGAAAAERRGAPRATVVRHLKGAANNLARVHYQLGRHRDCMAAYEECLRYAREIHDRPFEALSLNGIGIAHNALGDRQAALEAYEASLAVFREMGDKWRIAMVLTNTANLHFDEGRVEESMAAAKEGLAIRREIGDRWGGALILGNIGGHHRRLGNYGLALEALGVAVEDHRATGDRQGTARVLNEIAHVRAALGDAAGALAASDEAIRLYTEINNAHRLATARIERAELLLESGRPAEAEAILRPLLDNPEPSFRSFAGIGVRLALSRALRLSRPEEARALAAAALDFAMKESARDGEAAALVALADAEAALGDAAGAAAHVARARAMLTAGRDFEEALRAREVDARVRRAAGDLDGARALAKEVEEIAGARGAAAVRDRVRGWAAGI